MAAFFEKRPPRWESVSDAVGRSIASRPDRRGRYRRLSLACLARATGRYRNGHLRDRAPERAAARAAAFGIPAAYASAEQMLAENAFDALDVMTWRDGHVAMVRLAARDGIACLRQKPLAPTLAEAEALVEEVAGRIRLMVHENRRFAPHFRAIAGWLGARARRPHSAMPRHHEPCGLLLGRQGVRPAGAPLPWRRNRA